MTVVNGDILRVDLDFLLVSNVIAQNVFHYQYTGNPVLEDSEVVGDMNLMAQAWANLWAPVAGDANAVSQSSVSLRGVGGKFTPLGVLPVNIPGLSAQASLPQGCALLLRATIVGSTGQGRKFIPGLAFTTAPDGTWNATALTLGADLGALYVSDLTQLPFVIGEYQQGTFNTGTGILKPTTGTVFVNTEVNYQRRRRPGVGI